MTLLGSGLKTALKEKKRYNLLPPFSSNKGNRPIHNQNRQKFLFFTLLLLRVRLPQHDSTLRLSGTLNASSRPYVLLQPHHFLFPLPHLYLLRLLLILFGRRLQEQQRPAECVPPVR